MNLKAISFSSLLLVITTSLSWATGKESFHYNMNDNYWTIPITINSPDTLPPLKDREGNYIIRNS